MNKVSKKYKDSLSQKTVDELIEIILRKDDKEREKNKFISNLERKIHEFKNDTSELINNVDNLRDEICKIKDDFNNLLIERKDLQIIVDGCRKQNTVLCLLISILGAVVIIESLIILFL
jgi:flagellar biosynthesis chaperone FliJ